MVGYLTSEDGSRIDFNDGARIEIRWDSRKY